MNYLYVEMRRFGNEEGHSYIIHICDNNNANMKECHKIGTNERDRRGGKYEYVIFSFYDGLRKQIHNSADFNYKIETADVVDTQDPIHVLECQLDIYEAMVDEFETGGRAYIETEKQIDNYRNAIKKLRA